jgi:glycosyltransferase involved in cell wall biosynthesis
LLISSFLISSFLLADSDSLDLSNKQLKINLISRSNGKGLDTDKKILKEALEEMDCSVTIVDLTSLKWNRAHINIFLQDLVLEKFPWAQQNWFIPNPEWYDQDIRLLDKIDLILCRTKDVERIFQKMNKQTYYLGFTSPDCYWPDMQKDYLHFFHLAGGSALKGTKIIQNIWLSHPLFPLLTVINFVIPFTSAQSNLEWIQHRVSEFKLRQLQNQCGIHLCPSETEGFGHYVMEAMSAGAIVITTDAPPMNEFIEDQRCLVPYIKKTPLCLATRYEIDPVQLQNKIEYLISLPSEELEAISLHNRSVYLQKKQEFYEKLEELIWIASFAFER